MKQQLPTICCKYKIYSMKNLILIISVFISSAALSQSRGDIDKIEKGVLIKINEYRKSKLKDLFLMQDTISDGARKHSGKQSKAGSLFHAELEYWSCECSALLTTNKEFITFDNISTQIVQGWINSPLHNRCILSYGDLAGIGVSISDDGKIYFTFRPYCTPGYWDTDSRRALDRNY